MQQTDWWEGSLLGGLGMLHANAGRLGEAQAVSRSALEMAQALGDRQREGNSCAIWGCSTFAAADRRHPAVGGSAACGARSGHVQLEGIVQCNLGSAVKSTAAGLAVPKRFEAAVALARTASPALGGPVPGLPRAGAGASGPSDAARAPRRRGSAVEGLHGPTKPWNHALRPRPLRMECRLPGCQPCGPGRSPSHRHVTGLRWPDSELGQAAHGLVEALVSATQASRPFAIQAWPMGRTISAGRPGPAPA